MALKLIGTCASGAGIAALGARFGERVGGWAIGRDPSAGHALSDEAFAASSRPTRFVQIFLRGGWDALLATDPLDEARFGSDAFDALYKRESPEAVPGKPDLRLGQGLAPAVTAFSLMPTAFVNGIHNEITAHALAENYMYSGRLSLSATRSFPALSALLARKWGGQPAHVVFGGAIPLAETAFTHPPVVAANVDLFRRMIAGPDVQVAQIKSDDSLAAAEELAAKLDGLHRKRLPADASAFFEPWERARAGLAKVYALNLGEAFALDDGIRERYGVTDDSSLEALMAAAFLSLRTGLTRVVSVNADGFDTHADHFETHLPLLQRFARALDVFVADLAATPDPADAERTLAQTTLVSVTSEFVRTPKLNLQGGTDHWPSGSTILMGPGVADGRTFGRTDERYLPRGWTALGDVPFSQADKLTPSRVSASILSWFGLTDEAKTVSSTGIDGLFS